MGYAGSSVLADALDGALRRKTQEPAAGETAIQWTWRGNSRRRVFSM